jgi:hypothetical protein
MTSHARGITPLKSETKIRVPKLPAAHNFAFRFVPLWIVLFGASWGASYGWMKYMEGCCSATIDKQSFTYLEWVISSVIFLWTTLALASKLYRMSMLTQIVNSYMRLADSIFINSNDAVVVSNSILVFTLDNKAAGESAQKQYIIDFPDALAETMMSLLCAVILLLYELVYNMRDDPRYVDEISKEFIKNQFMEQGNLIYYLFTLELKEQKLSAGERSYSNVLLQVIKERIVSMGTQCVKLDKNVNGTLSTPQMLLNTQVILTDTATLIEKINNYYDYPLMMSEEWWISIPIMFIGLVFPFLIPPVFYATMGSHILFIGPVIFFFIGSPVLVNILLGDPVKWPSNLHMQKVYDQLYFLSKKVQSQYKQKFDSSLAQKTKEYDALKTQKFSRALSPLQIQSNPSNPSASQIQQVEIISGANTEQGIRLSSEINSIKQYTERNMFEKTTSRWFQSQSTDVSSNMHTL